MGESLVSFLRSKRRDASILFARQPERLNGKISGFQNKWTNWKKLATQGTCRYLQITLTQEEELAIVASDITLILKQSKQNPYAFWTLFEHECPAFEQNSAIFGSLVNFLLAWTRILDYDNNQEQEERTTTASRRRDSGVSV
ncbi:hypothetical protein RF11_06325 [Thelohanellus kitauei]|uniref:Uncharacterized protein n=1 Tax=Thelohanellus kitauei TaxID=669202 RepID=A0A0C2JG08_THEKT|nr:hypothetical protein RF11_06325 [Thelohanellus kitauei]